MGRNKKIFNKFNKPTKMSDARRKHLKVMNKNKWKYVMESETDSEDESNQQRVSPISTVEDMLSVNDMQNSMEEGVSGVTLIKQEHGESLVYDIYEEVTNPEDNHIDMVGNSAAISELNQDNISKCKEDASVSHNSSSSSIKTSPRKRRRCSEKKKPGVYTLKPAKIPKIIKSLGTPFFPKEKTAAHLKAGFYKNCQVCFNDHSEDSCPLIYCRNVIDNDESFVAGYGMPSQVVLGKSKIYPERPSLFARDDIPEFTKFGPLKGKLHTREDLKTIKRSEFDIEHFWPLHVAEENLTYIDSYINTTNLAESNWLRFLLPAPFDKTYSTYNIQRVTIVNEIYFVTTKDIKAGDELFMHAIEPPERIFFNMRATGTDELALKCSYCKYSSTLEKYHLSLVNMKHTGTFISPLYSIRHYRLEHTLNPGVIANARIYFCSKCNVEVNNPHDLNKHKQEVHFIDTHRLKHNKPIANICSLCLESFESRNALDTHRVTVHPAEGEGPKQCGRCDKTLLNSLQLHRHHLLNHGSEWQTQEATCDQCAKTFRNKRVLENHIKKVHSKAHAKICDVCGRSFHDGYQLRVHSLTHSGLKPFQCDFQSVEGDGMCTYACTTKQWMQKHYKSTHGLNDDSMPEIKRKFQF